MLSNDKFKYEEIGNDIIITYKWFKPVALFLVFFCIAWNAFLIVWYSMAFSFETGTPMDWLMIIFPIGHVAVGVGLTYYTLCLFINSTTITASPGNLEINSGPIPWWKGNQSIPTSEIDQLFVKEIIRSGENGTSKTYRLQAKLNTGKAVTLWSEYKMTDAHDLRELEKVIEDKLGIADEAVSGEYESHTKPKPQIKDKPRPAEKPKQIHNPEVQHLQKGHYVDYESQSYEAAHLSQYDWNNGDSDKLIQLVDFKNNSKLLYIKQDKGLHLPYLESKMDFMEASRIFFLKADPPKQIDYNNTKYNLYEYLKGKMWTSEKSNPIDTEQWFYLSEDKEQSLRIVDTNNLFSKYLGKREISAAFSKIITP